MRNWSLVFFTLFTQSAVGIVWVNVLSRWFGENRTGGLSSLPMIAAFVVSGSGLLMALVHLAKPRLAPHILRNLGFSWLSREVLLVQAFVGAVALLVLLSLLDVSGGMVVLETAVCLLGGAALFAMTRVYMLKTVPVWNSPATCLEFAGSAALLGGALSFVLSALEGTTHFCWSTVVVISGVAIVSGLALKIAAISPARAAEKAAGDQSWYETAATPLSTGTLLTARLVLFLIGSIMVMAALSLTGPAWLWAALGLACFSTGEVLGRQHFYRSYRRIGL